MVVVKTEIQCSSCNKESLHPVRNLLKAEAVNCPFCGAPTDLAVYRPRLRDISEKYRAVEELFEP